jgi:hypothetical protein
MKDGRKARQPCCHVTFFCFRRWIVHQWPTPNISQKASGDFAHFLFSHTIMLERSTDTTRGFQTTRVLDSRRMVDLKKRSRVGASPSALEVEGSRHRHVRGQWRPPPPSSLSSPHAVFFFVSPLPIVTNYPSPSCFLRLSEASSDRKELQVCAAGQIHWIWRVDDRRRENSRWCQRKATTEGCTKKKLKAYVVFFVRLTANAVFWCSLKKWKACVVRWRCPWCQTPFAPECSIWCTTYWSTTITIFAFFVPSWATWNIRNSCRSKDNLWAYQLHWMDDWKKITLISHLLAFSALLWMLSLYRETIFSVYVHMGCFCTCILYRG